MELHYVKGPNNILIKYVLLYNSSLKLILYVSVHQSIVLNLLFKFIISLTIELTTSAIL